MKEKAERMELPHGMVIIRDVNRMCQSESVYALIEGETRPRKINRARKRQGRVEIRTVAQDLWMGPVVEIEFRKKELGFTTYCLAQDIR